MIQAKILLDSVNPLGDRLTTWLLTYPRFVHAEFNTHRMFSRNASSSRAIPIQKMIDAVLANPALPVFWGKNQAGMQANVELDDKELTQFRRVFGADGTWKMMHLTDRAAAKFDWLEARDNAVASVKKLMEVGLHKQLSNRLLEPWMHITVVMSATELENFFSLRAHEAAMPEFRSLAYLMLDLYQQSVPVQKQVGEWHIPFGDKMPAEAKIDSQLKIATARCARTSYLTFDGEMNVEKDYEIHDKLSTSGHWSPFEHCAQALGERKQVGNFVGWFQYRKTFITENRTDGRVQRYNRL
jgi:Thymidylate synthase complementing protein